MFGDEMAWGRPRANVGPELQNCPTRQGFLALGDCTVTHVLPLEACDTGPGDPLFGVERCRCLRSEPLVVTRAESEAIVLWPHELVRRDLEVDVICDL
jgi:hypothetical protein